MEKARVRVEDAADAVEKDIHDRVEAFDKELENLRNILDGRQKDIDKLNDEISKLHRHVANLKSDIESKKRWYDKSKWYQKVFRFGEMTAYVGAKGIELASTYAEIGVLEGLKITAVSLREAAKEAIRWVRSQKDNVKALVSGSIEALVDLSNEAFDRAQDALTLTQMAVGAFEEWSTHVLENAKVLEELFKINTVEFDFSMHEIQGGNVPLKANVEFLKVPKQLDIEFNFTNPRVAIESIVQTLKTGKKRPDDIAIEAKKEGADPERSSRAVLEQYPHMNAPQLAVCLLRAGYEMDPAIAGLSEVYRDENDVPDVLMIMDAIDVAMDFNEGYNKV